MSDEQTRLDDDTEVWFCPNGEWVVIDDGSFTPCGALCGPTRFGDLPMWAQEELLRKGVADE